MPRRTHQDAKAALDTHPYRSEQEKREFPGFMAKRESEVKSSVQQSVREALTQLRQRIEDVERRYAAHDKDGERLKQEVASGRITAAEAGKRVDQHRKELERLDALVDGLIDEHVSAQDKFEDPIAYRDQMYERFPALEKPDWPW